LLYHIYEVHQQQQEAQRRSRDEIGHLTGTALLAVLADWLIAMRTPDSISLIAGLGDALPREMSHVLGVLFVLGALALLIYCWFLDRPEEIYYPPLDEELRDKERKARGLD
jgi:hypothetical protein